MGRLIDADELKAVIDGYDYSEEGYADMINFDFLYEVIDKQTTAYDIEKVVEEIACLNLDGIKMIEDGKHELIRKSEVIEIIRKGGVNNG